MSTRQSLLLLSLVGLCSGFLPVHTAPKPTSKAGSVPLFGVAEDDSAPSEVSRRAALIGAAALTVGGSILAPPTANAFQAPLFEQVKAIEYANYMGSPGRPINTPNSKGAPEKHLPQVKLDGTNVEVSVPHVMTEEHYIQFMWLKDAKSNEVVVVKALPPTDPSPPTLKAKVPEGVELRPYLYCNLHGLWKGETFTVA